MNLTIYDLLKAERRLCKAMISRIFLHIILVSQLYAIFVFWCYFGVLNRDVPFFMMSDRHMALMIFSGFIVLCGVAGTILVWAGKSFGYTLSIAHQFLIVPVIYSPPFLAAFGIPPNLYFYGIHDAMTLIVAAFADSSTSGFFFKIGFGELAVVSVIFDAPGEVL